MNRFAALTGVELQVRQPSLWKREFEMSNESGPVATIVFPSIFKREAVASSDEGKWTLRERGLWKRKIEFLLPEKEKPLMTLELGQFALTSKVKLPRYRMLRLTRNLLRTSYRLTTTMNAEICSLNLQILPKFKGKMVIDSRGAEYEELPWVVFLVWFVSIIDQRRRRR